MFITCLFIIMLRLLCELNSKMDWAWMLRVTKQRCRKYLVVQYVRTACGQCLLRAQDQILRDDKLTDDCSYALHVSQ